MKTSFTIFCSFFLLMSCTKKDEVVLKPNEPPKSFVVNSKPGSNGSEVILNWTKAIDPDGDLVTYTVIYKDTLAKNLSDTTFTVKNLPFNTDITGSVIAKDAKGAVTKATFYGTSGDEPPVTYKIPDANFEKALIALKLDNILDGELKIKKSNADTISTLVIRKKAIANLQGIEVFTKLRKLYCDDNQLTSLDVSKNTLLTELGCDDNQLSSLDISKNTALRYFSCMSNKIGKLDVSNNTDLRKLYCTLNNLTNLDVSKNVALQDLRCAFNQIGTLNVSQNTLLNNLLCYFNRIITLDISKNTQLEGLYCENNQLNALDISNQTNLIDLDCSSNNIQTICVKDLLQVYTYWSKDNYAKYKVCK